MRTAGLIIFNNRWAGQVVEIIKKRKGHMVGSDEVEIDIDTLDGQTLRELERYVTGILRPKVLKT
jgi:hypothetical protein